MNEYLLACINEGEVWALFQRNWEVFCTFYCVVFPQGGRPSRKKMRNLWLGAAAAVTAIAWLLFSSDPPSWSPTSTTAWDNWKVQLAEDLIARQEEHFKIFLELMFLLYTIEILQFALTPCLFFMDSHLHLSTIDFYSMTCSKISAKYSFLVILCFADHRFHWFRFFFQAIKLFIFLDWSSR